MLLGLADGTQFIISQEVPQPSPILGGDQGSVKLDPGFIRVCRCGYNAGFAIRSLTQV